MSSRKKKNHGRRKASLINNNTLQIWRVFYKDSVYILNSGTYLPVGMIKPGWQKRIPYSSYSRWCHHAYWGGNPVFLSFPRRRESSEKGFHLLLDSGTNPEWQRPDPLLQIPGDDGKESMTIWSQNPSIPLYKSIILSFYNSLILSFCHPIILSFCYSLNLSSITLSPNISLSKHTPRWHPSHRLRHHPSLRMITASPRMSHADFHYM